MASMRHSVPHVGGSTCLGDPHPNARSYGIELPAKMVVKDLFLELVFTLIEVVPSLDKWTMHKTIDNRRTKRDPVETTGFTAEWMEDTGLTFAGRWSTGETNE